MAKEVKNSKKKVEKKVTKPKKEEIKKVDEKKKVKNTNKENKLILIILIAIILALLVTIITIKIVKRNEIDTDGKIVSELHNYFNTDDLSNCDGLVNYNDKKVNFDSISSDAKLCLAYQKTNLDKNIDRVEFELDNKKEICTTEDGFVFKKDNDKDKCTINVIERDKIDKTYLKLFGKEVVENEKFNIDGSHICYLKDNKYYCGLAEFITLTLGNESTIYRIVDKAIEKGSRVTIYDYFVRINSGKCYSNFVNDTENEKCNKVYKKKTKIKYDFMKNYGVKYKHIFEKAKDGSYYWVSSEPIK